MKNRSVSLVLAWLLFVGTFTPTVGYAFACERMAEAMTVSCPMNRAAEPVEAKAEAEPAPMRADHSCCAGEDAAPRLTTPEHTLSGGCCCDLTAAPEQPQYPALPVLPEVLSLPVQLPLSPLTPPALVTVAHNLPIADSDAPRGPPRSALSPRAPPVFS